MPQGGLSLAVGTTASFAFTHEPSHFVRLGFTLVPHMWVPEKIERDCRSCAQFRKCGQYAVTLTLRRGVVAVVEDSTEARHERWCAAGHRLEGRQGEPFGPEREREGIGGAVQGCQRPVVELLVDVPQGRIAVVIPSPIPP